MIALSSPRGDEYLKDFRVARLAFVEMVINVYFNRRTVLIFNEE